jgi:hypothetical protein
MCETVTILDWALGTKNKCMQDINPDVDNNLGECHELVSVRNVVMHALSDSQQSDVEANSQTLSS